MNWSAPSGRSRTTDPWHGDKVFALDSAVPASACFGEALRAAMAFFSRWTSALSPACEDLPPSFHHIRAGPGSTAKPGLALKLASMKLLTNAGQSAGGLGRQRWPTVVRRVRNPAARKRPARAAMADAIRNPRIHSLLSARLLRPAGGSASKRRRTDERRPVQTAAIWLVMARRHGLAFPSPRSASCCSSPA